MVLLRAFFWRFGEYSDAILFLREDMTLFLKSNTRRINERNFFNTGYW